MQSLEPSEASVSRMEALPLISAQTATRRRGSHKFRLASPCINLACLSFSLLLLWQLVGTVLYFIRAYYCCLKERHTTFRCSNFTAIPHSQELELAWLISQDISIAIFSFTLSKVPGFLGYSVIFRKATRLPAFWSLTMLHAMQVIGFGIIIYFNNVPSMQICLATAFSFHGIALVAIISVLNFTPVNRVRNSCSFLVFLLCKLTLVALSVQIFIIFVVGSVQFAFKVTGLDEVGRSADFVTLFRKLREFPQVVFYYSTAAFVWHKLFLDNRNILSHYQLLKLRDHLQQSILN